MTTRFENAIMDWHDNKEPPIEEEEEEIIHMDGEPCSCPSCEAAFEEDFALAMRDYQMYARKDERGVMDIRTGKYVIKRKDCEYEDYE